MLIKNWWWMSAFNISSEHEGELVKFMKYFGSKKEEFFKDRKRDLNDFLSESLNDEIYNKDDVNYLMIIIFTLFRSKIFSKNTIKKMKTILKKI